MSSSLRLDGLKKHFGQTAAVDGISLDIEEGEFFTLLGPSGCGKSTTLGLIAGLERPTAGRILLGGVDITNKAPEHRGIGVVFQNYALFPHMTVLENVMFPLRMRGVGRHAAAQRAREALALVQLAQDSAFPNEISGGQAQRVAVARALVFEPSILLMDEPLAALDRRLRHDMQFELRNLQHRVGATIVYVTHDQEEALVLSDRIAVMRNGRLEQVGPPHELYSAPTNAFVARFLGESNTVPVQVVDRLGDMVVLSPEGSEHIRLPVPRGDREMERGVFVVRPENVLISSQGGGAPADHFSIDAKVLDVVFVGDHFLVEASTADGLTLKAKATGHALDKTDYLALRQRTVLFHWPVSVGLFVADDHSNGSHVADVHTDDVPMLSH
jgi:ABC-type Fe3+/spermidine/putrescine transport system ATPase subunit